jgi:hypothetical protein
MPNERHLSVLRKGVEKWNLWRERHPHVQPDLRDADLREVDLDVAIYTHPDVDLDDYPPDESGMRWSSDPYGVDLRKALLNGANLSGQALTIAELEGADLSDAILSGARLEMAKLKGAHLARAQLTRTHFDSCDLEDADFAQAEMAQTILSDIDLSVIRGLTTVVHHAASIVSIDTLVKSRGRIPEAFLRGIGLPDSWLSHFKSLSRSLEPSKFHSCFISYSHADKNFARRLENALQHLGIRCWLDERQLVPGDDMYERVDRGILRSERFLLCCSRAALTSWWVDNEIGAVFEKEQRWTRSRQRKIQLLIPLNLDGYLFSPEWRSGYRTQLRRRLAADFVGWGENEGKFDEQIRRVAEALRKRQGRTR